MGLEDLAERLFVYRDPDALWGAFIWNGTQEGPSYWSKAARGRVPYEQWAPRVIEYCPELSSYYAAYQEAEVEWD